MKLIFAAACVVVALTSVNAQAAFNHTDWKVAGDQRSTIDTDTGLEWLKANETAGKSIAQVESLLSTTYKGWRLPTATEVEQMMDNFFSSTFNVGQTATRMVWTVF